MPDLTPITREEMFLDGNTELTPITREEKILAGEDIDVITRREWFLKKYRSGGDITIEPITITENGTTTAPSGKAYSPIYTNVGLPENAYLLKDIEDTPCDIATFTDGSNLPMPSLKVGIEPIQEGSGDPSPSNVRPISGWSGANVSVCGKNKLNLNTNVTVLSGSVPSAVNITSSEGTATITENYYDRTANKFGWAFDVKANQIYSLSFIVDSTSTIAIKIYDSNGDVVFNTTASPTETINKQFTLTKSGTLYFYVGISTWGQTINITKAQIEEGSTATAYEPYNPNSHTYNIPFTDGQGNPIEVFGGECDVVNGGGSAYKEYDSYNGETLIGPWISDRDVYAPNTSPTIGAQVVDMGDTSTFISQPTSIKSLEGTNNVWGDCGSIKEGQYFAKGEEE